MVPAVDGPKPSRLCFREIVLTDHLPQSSPWIPKEKAVAAAEKQQQQQQQPEPLKMLPAALNSLLSHIYTLHLFTRSDHKTVVLPWTIFAICSTLSGAAMTSNTSPSVSSILSNSWRPLVWMWLNLFISVLSNQRLPSSILEDAADKPWRPLPSKRLTPKDARRLLFHAIPIVYAITFFLGGSHEALLGMVLSWMYNDLAGANEMWAVRYLLNALGLTAWSFGATKVLCNATGASLNAVGERWLLLVGAVVVSTIQLMDFRDMEGDAKTGRSTLPLVWGNDASRLFTALTMSIWSFACPAFWTAGLVGSAGPILIGITIAARLLRYRTAEADGLTWKLWGLWMMSIFVLPALSNPPTITAPEISLPWMIMNLSSKATM